MEATAKKENVCAEMDLQAAHVKKIYKVTTLTQTQVNIRYQTWIKKKISAIPSICFLAKNDYLHIY